jgi:hypothetical protein
VCVSNEGYPASLEHTNTYLARPIPPRSLALQSKMPAQPKGSLMVTKMKEDSTAGYTSEF